MARSIDAVVVGGGMAGLAAAAYLARAGARVTLLEKAAELGGRATSQGRDGFTFNLGPHALYRSGAGIGVLRELGVPFTGRVPPAKGSLAYHEGKLHLLPVDPGSLVATGLLGLRSKWRAGRALAALPRMKAASLAGRSVRDWLRDEEPGARSLLEAVVRVSTYANDPERLDAGTAVAQVQRALAASVLYLDGGWQTLVEGLRAAAVASRVRIERAHVTSVTRADSSWMVRTSDDRCLAASSVVLAVPPQDAAALAGPAAGAGTGSIPVLAAALDLALRRVPQPERRFALGIDRPFYFSLHSATARLAPPEGGLLHAAAYLGAEPAPDPAALERELEAGLDRMQPGWRDEVVHRRFLPHLVVSHALPAAERGGEAGRPPVRVPGAPGLFRAGDWVGPEGLLADASLASARAAATALLAQGRELRASA